MRQHANRIALDVVEQLLEQGERLALVLLLGVLLRIAAQVDTVTQVVHGRQMVLPQVVEHAQEDLLLEAAQRVAAGQLLLLRIILEHLGVDALAQGFLVELVVLVQPLLHRQLEAEVALQRRLEAADVPLLGQ
ncbi:hypothetical protein D9M71_679320 [compost metagenome]